ncbi:MAG: hypothetical protein VXY90_02050, partial [Pseudomonadota bacterium]|nr:hypothetical protein [Pseudomonadota bacterium]
MTKNPNFSNGHIYSFHASKIQNLEKIEILIFLGSAAWPQALCIMLFPRAAPENHFLTFRGHGHQFMAPSGLPWRLLVS